MTPTIPDKLWCYGACARFTVHRAKSADDQITRVCAECGRARGVAPELDPWPEDPCPTRK